MTYIKIDDDTWIKYVEPNSSVVLKKPDLLARKNNAENALSLISAVSDEELLAWAKAAYRINEREMHERELSMINTDLAEMV